MGVVADFSSPVKATARVWPERPNIEGIWRAWRIGDLEAELDYVGPPEASG